MNSACFRLKGVKFRICVVLSAAGLIPAAIASDWSTDLWLDGGGFWTNRVSVTAENIGTSALKGFGVSIPLPAGAGGDLRITDDKGRQLAFSVIGGKAVFPVTGEAQSTTRYYLYWGNPAAREIPYNSWQVGEDSARKVKLETGAAETLPVEIVGETAEWAAGGWIWRIPVRVANFTGRCVKNRCFRFRLAEATRAIPSPEWRFEYKGRRFAAEVNGSDLVFRHTLDPRTIHVFYVYVKTGRSNETVCAVERQAQGAVLPNDTGIDDKPVFPRGLAVYSAHVGAVENRRRDSGQGLVVAQTDLAALVFPENPVEDERGGFRLELARNEKETLQLAVRSPSREKDFSCEVGAPVNASGKMLQVESGWAEYVFVDAPSTFYVHDTVAWELMYPHTRHPASDGWSGMWPDPVVPGGKTALEAGSTKAFRLLVSAPADAEPGEYRGTLAWKSSGKVVRRDSYSVKVWNFELPQKRGFSATFDVRGLSSRKERDKVYARLKEYGIDADQSCRTLVFTRDADGGIKCDFSEFDRLTELYFGKWKFTGAYFPRNPFSVFGWSRKPADFLGEKAYEAGEKDRSRLRPAYKAAYQGALKLFWEHLNARGWDKRFTLFVSDEPHLHLPEIAAQLKAVCAMIHEVDPAIPTYVSTWVWADGLDDSIDVWGISASGRFPAAKIAGMKAKGSRFWFTTDAQFPLDTPYLAAEYLFPVIGYFLGVEKYECWNCINFPKEGVWKYGFDKFRPRFGIPGKKDRWVRVPAGDGVLLYPSKSGDGYVPTVRIDAVRDGLELFEYLALLNKLSCPEAERILGEFRNLAAVPNAGGRYSKRMLPEPDKIGKLRSAAGALLDAR